MVLGAILGVAGDQLTRFASAYPNYYYTKKLQDDAQKHAEYLSSTAHQREVVDLRKAGINPIHTATGGSGASSPTASSGTINSAQGIDAIGAVSSFFNLKNQSNATKADVNNKNAQAGLALSQSIESLANANKHISDSNLTDVQKGKAMKELSYFDSNFKAQLDNIKAQTANLKSNARQKDAEASLLSVEEKIKNKQLGWYDIENVAKGLGISLGAAISLLGLKKIPKGLITPAGQIIKVAPKNIPY